MPASTGPQKRCARSRFKPKAVDEFDLIRRYFDRSESAAGVIVGIGDDGAVLEPSAGMQQVVVVDTLVEGVHFPDSFNPSDIGYRAVAVNVSDIAAMGAQPRWMTLALSMPEAHPEWLEAFSEGLLAAAAEYELILVGGDTTRAPQVVVTIQVYGEVEPGGAVQRNGARTGDILYVTGTLGDAAAGLQGLMQGQPVRQLLDRFARPAARVSAGRALREHASAMIDLSDGLLGDVGKLVTASNAGAEIDLDKLPLSDALREHFPPEEQIRFALGGGDDYELCFTATGEVPDCGIVPVTAIGVVTAERGVVCTKSGSVVDLADPGYRHFT
jgi:thiamine-monophosphate kinase